MKIAEEKPTYSLVTAAWRSAQWIVMDATRPSALFPSRAPLPHV